MEYLQLTGNDIDSAVCMNIGIEIDNADSILCLPLSDEQLNDTSSDHSAEESAPEEDQQNEQSRKNIQIVWPSSKHNNRLMCVRYTNRVHNIQPYNVFTEHYRFKQLTSYGRCYAGVTLNGQVSDASYPINLHPIHSSCTCGRIPLVQYESTSTINHISVHTGVNKLAMMCTYYTLHCHKLK
jgi:hypothetical protein